VPQSSRQIWEEEKRDCRESKMKTCIMALYKDAIWLPSGSQMAKCTARVSLVGIHLQNRNLKDIHPPMSFLSPINYVFPSNQTTIKNM